MTLASDQEWPRAAVLNIVGLCGRHLGEHTPHLSAFANRDQGGCQVIDPVLPALTCSVQSTYLTGKMPNEHGIVGNGWYDRELNEHHFWKQSNQLVQSRKIWEVLREKKKDFSCANLFWWFNMHSSVDHSITPRPLYRADGFKSFDVHTQPMHLREEIKADLGDFPFHGFWGPKAGITSSTWIAESAKWTEEKHSPDLSLVYLPHLDYDLQRLGPNDPNIPKALNEIDQVVGELISFYEKRGIRLIILSEYGITEVKNVIYPNRVFRDKGWLSIKDELGLEYLDCGGSKAFTITDHQVAHVYLQDESPSFRKEVRNCLESMEGVEKILEGESRKEAGLNHERSGDFVIFSQEDAWFAYYHWLDDSLAPDFARCVDVHRKYGYDPAELFVDPKISFPTLKVVKKLIGKKLGFRTNMDLIPLDPTLVRGSHGTRPKNKLDYPVIFGDGIHASNEYLAPTEVMNSMLALFES
ncbi:alkaline phosphatase family protein [Opitutales bacterium]|nr:alkaline phosphatase family protein [Opitutales bacterium]